MTEQEYKELKKVLADAPEGATHVEVFTQAKQSPYYYRRELKDWCGKFIYDWWDRDNQQWLNSSHPTGDFHSLSDLRTMVEQYEENKRLKAKVAELEGHNKNAHQNLSNCAEKFKDYDKEIAELENQNLGLTKTLVELEEELNFMRKAYVKSLKEIKKLQEQGHE